MVLSPFSGRKAAWSAVAAVVVVAMIVLGFRSYATDQREREFSEQHTPLAASLAKHRGLLARASALQPYFREMSSEITPSRCRELMDLIRAHDDRDPFDDNPRCEEDPPSPMDLCDAARVFAEVAGGETQLSRPVGVLLQSRKHGQERGEERLFVTTLFLSEKHALLEMHQLAFPAPSMDGKPLRWLVRSLGDDGLFERCEEAGRIDVRATTPDGTLRMHRREEGKSNIIEWLRESRSVGTSIYLWPSRGVRYEAATGVGCEPATWSELWIVKQAGSNVCTRVRRHDQGSVQTWQRGTGCESAGGQWGK